MTGMPLAARYRLRTAERRDEAAVSDLLEASYPSLLAGSYDSAVLRTALSAMTRANPSLLACPTWFVVEADGGEVVGCGGWTPERPGTGEVDPGLGHLRHFATHPEHTRRGIGHAVGERCLATAREAGIVELECYSTLVAVEFYESLGLRRVRDGTIPMPDGVGGTIALPMVHMRGRVARV